MDMSTERNLKMWAHTLRQRAKTFVGAYPRLFFPLFRLRPAFDDLLVTRSTDICIEGFPRSANSFAVRAFEHAQQQPVRIAHHTHVPANPIRACEWGIPTVVLIRSPYDAIVSKIALEKEGQHVERDIDSPKQRVSFRGWIQAWLSFYRSIRPYWAQERLMIAPFHTVIRSMDMVVKKINNCYGTDFVPFNHTEENVATVQSKQGYHASPNNRRDAFKKDTRADFDDALREDATLKHSLQKAERLYASYVESAAMGATE